MVEIRNLTIRYGKRTLLHRLDWVVRKGERWLLTGANGSGKTTLLSLITGDNPAAYGHDIRVFGHPRAPGRSIWAIRKHIGQVSPEIHCHFDTSMSVLDAVLSGRFDDDGGIRPARTADRKAAWTLLAEMGLTEDARRPLRSLSPGRQRLVLTARAILPKPKLLILDEPCQNLDVAARKMLLQMLSKLLRKHVIETAILTAHHPEDVPRGFSQLLCLDSVTGNR